MCLGVDSPIFLRLITICESFQFYFSPPYLNILSFLFYGKKDVYCVCLLLISASLIVFSRIYFSSY